MVSFLGPGGLVDHNYMELTADIIDEYRNTGGFDIIGSGRTKLEAESQFEKDLKLSKNWALKHWLSLVVMILIQMLVCWLNTMLLRNTVYR